MSSLNVNPEFNTEMEQLTPETRAHADRFNERYGQLLGNDAFLKGKLEDANTNIERAMAVAQGKSAGYVFNTYSELIAYIAVPANAEKFRLGDQFLIKTTDVPDYWWDNTVTTAQTDSAGNVISGKNTSGKIIGALVELEARKIDLSKYDANDAALFNNMSDQYSSARTYDVGDICIHNNDLYKCVTAVEAAETFNASKWNKTSLAALHAEQEKKISENTQRLQEQIEMCKENLITFPYCATSTGSYAKSFNSSSLTTVEAKNDGSLLIGSNGKIPSKTNQVLFRLIHDNFENIPLYNDIYSMDPHFENRPSASGVALAVSFERAKDSELETFYVTSPVEINNIDGKYTKIKYISVWLSTATASFENVKMKPTITRGGITEKRDVVSQKLSMDAIVARTRNSLNIVHLPLKETKTLTLAQLYNSYAKQNDVLYVTVIDYSDSKSYKSSTMLLFIDDFQIYAISTEGLLKYDNVNDKWAVIIPRA